VRKAAAPEATASEDGDAELRTQCARLQHANAALQKALFALADSDGVNGEAIKILASSLSTFP
jgi:hypothetical protein